MTDLSQQIADLREAVDALEIKAERLLEKMVELGILHESEVEQIFGPEDQQPEVTQ